MEGFGPYLKLVITTAALYGCHMSWAVCHEYVGTHEYLVKGELQRFPYVVTISFLNAVVSTTVSLVAFLLFRCFDRRVKPMRVHLWSVAINGLVHVLSNPMSFYAVRYLPYPIYLATKMCRVLPTIVVGALAYGVKYSRQRCVAAACLCIGVVSFSLFNEEKKQDGVETAESNMVLGLVLCWLTLILDGYLGGSQDAIFIKAPQAHYVWVMLVVGVATTVSNLVALLGIEAMSLVMPNTSVMRPEIAGALEFFKEAPEALWDMVKLGLLSGAGKIPIFYALEQFSSVTVTTITTSRKILSVFVSVIAFGHYVTGYQWISLLLVVFGVVVETRESVHHHNAKREALKVKKTS